ncbi:MAG: dihydropteroate synthase [Clostridia bacterium]|nr:dihydropteroate synthase [Clostridia bacterium]
MGILNVTPDSFSDGGQFTSVTTALNHAIAMIKADADIIDIGGESTRPGSEFVDAEEEKKRVIPVIQELKRYINKPISIDTYKASVAKAAFEAGANILNDVWGLQKEPEIAKVAAEYDVPVIMMHNQEDTVYETDLMEAIKEFFEKSIAIAHEAGIKDEKIILDPGIGFGKTVKQNLEVMNRLEELQALGYPVLLGISRKSIIGKTLDLPSHDRLEGTIALNATGIVKGAEIIRVHDLKEGVRTARMMDAVVRGLYEE